MSTVTFLALLLAPAGYGSPLSQSRHRSSTLVQRQYGYSYYDRPYNFNYGYLGLAIAIVVILLALAIWAGTFRLKYGYWGYGCCCVSKEKRLERRRTRCHNCGALTLGACQCTPMWVPVTVAPGGTAFAMTPTEYAAHLNWMAQAQPGAPGHVPGHDVMKARPQANAHGVTEYFQSADHTPAARPVGGYYNAENEQQWAAVPGSMPGHWRVAPPPPSAQQASPAAQQAEAQPPGGSISAPQPAAINSVTEGQVQGVAQPKKGLKRFFK